jgi:hypothetical protein
MAIYVYVQLLVYICLCSACMNAGNACIYARMVVYQSDLE